MKKSTLLPLLFAVLFSQKTAALPAARALIPDAAHRHGSKPKKPKDCPATLYFTNGKRLQVAYLMELGDTSITAFVKYSDMKGGYPVSFPIRQIKKVRIKTGLRNHVEGALVGIGIGAVPMVLVAGTVGSTENCPDVPTYHDLGFFFGGYTSYGPDPDCVKKHQRWALFTFLGGIASTAILSGIRGTARHRTVHISPDPQMWLLEKELLAPFVKK